MPIEIRIVGPELIFWSQTFAPGQVIEIPDDDKFSGFGDVSHLITGEPLLVLDYSRIEIVQDGAILGRYAIEDCILKCSGMIVAEQSGPAISELPPAFTSVIVSAEAANADSAAMQNESHLP